MHRQLDNNSYKLWSPEELKQESIIKYCTYLGKQSFLCILIIGDRGFFDYRVIGNRGCGYAKHNSVRNGLSVKSIFKFLLFLEQAIKAPFS